MNYAAYHATFTVKAKGYPISTCLYALEDCHRTLKLWGDEISTDYSTRLWAEIDALRERLAHLQRKHN
jgi:hypothetical protein